MWHQPPDPSEYEKPKPLTIEDIRNEAAAKINATKAREMAMCLRVARRVAAKLYAGEIRYHNGGRVSVWVWVWDGDAVFSAGNSLFKALAEVFKDSGLRIDGFSPGLFSITVYFDGLMP